MIWRVWCIEELRLNKYCIDEDLPEMARCKKEEAMTVKVLIKRNVTESAFEGLDFLLRRIRSVCLMQRGYISGQTLRRLDKPGEFLVISVWESLEDWENWFNSSEREKLQFEIDSLLGAETRYEIYS